MQGHAFLGPHTGRPREYLHGFRGRMDERVDMVRSIRNARFIYLRNYMPHRPQGDRVAYSWQTPTTRVWRELFDAGLKKASGAGEASSFAGRGIFGSDRRVVRSIREPEMGGE